MFLGFFSVRRIEEAKPWFCNKDETLKKWHIAWDVCFLLTSGPLDEDAALTLLE